MSRPKNFAKLVLDVEDTTQIDYNSWLQDMQERLSDMSSMPMPHEKPETNRAINRMPSRDGVR